jgi:Beta protein
MNFGPDHYVPMLKVKRGEKTALSLLSDAVCVGITPLLEIVERKENKLDPTKTPTIDGHINTAFKNLADSVARFDRVLLDVHEIKQDGEAAAAQVFDRAVSEGIVFTPVTSPSFSIDFVPALAHRRHGLGLRITRAEFASGNLPSLVDAFLAIASVKPEDIDLIVDVGAVDQMIAPGIMALTEQFLAVVPHHTRWRTFTVSGSAFPLSMGVVGSDSHGYVDREEWLAWRDGLYVQRGQLIRLPTYSDCGIQHPTGVENFDPVTMKPSAAIRYAAGDQWLLVKGVSTRKSPPSQQFPVLAYRLVNGSLKGSFQGDAHCAGCSSMVAAAAGAPKLGSPEVWRHLGTIHHLTTVTEQLAALSWT